MQRTLSVNATWEFTNVVFAETTAPVSTRPSANARLASLWIIKFGYTVESYMNKILHTAYRKALTGELCGVCCEDFGNKWPLYNGGALYFLQISIFCMMTSSNENIFRVTGPSWGESTGHRWIPFTKASDAAFWCFLWSAPEQTVEQAIQMPVIWDATFAIMTSLKYVIGDLCGYRYIRLIRFDWGWIFDMANEFVLTRHQAISCLDKYLFCANH